ncbi:MAG: hypothetical protein IJW21_06620 [Clostridia bacterium]|nr:hypothetical protein [Clostridia bacterium]
MFTNISRTLKTLAVFNLLIVPAVCAIFTVISLTILENIILALFFVFIGFSFSWIPSLLFYAVGEITEKLTEIEKNTKNKLS